MLDDEAIDRHIPIPQKRMQGATESTVVVLGTMLDNETCEILPSYPRCKIQRGTSRIVLDCRVDAVLYN